MGEDPVKALTFWQPWASLAAEGVKTIETRSWPAPKGLIGQRIAIHAAKKQPTEAEVFGGWTLRRTSWRPAAYQLVQRPATPESPHTLPTIELPLGKVAGSAVLAACVPMRAKRDATADEPELLVDAESLWRPETGWVSIADQLPFGDFAPGRWAWILADAAPITTYCPRCWGSGADHTHADECDPRCDGSHQRADGTSLCPQGPDRCQVCLGNGHCPPIEATGRQGIWEWTP